LRQDAALPSTPLAGRVADVTGSTRGIGNLIAVIRPPTASAASIQACTWSRGTSMSMWKQLRPET
jgi:hypothetical protein